MKDTDLLNVIERPKGWSKSAYYRLRSICSRVKKGSEKHFNVTDDNLDEFLSSIRIRINRKGPGAYSRTHKTYISELRRYFNYLKELKHENN